MITRTVSRPNEPDLSQCPRCTQLTANVQGVVNCPVCGWTDQEQA